MVRSKQLRLTWDAWRTERGGRAAIMARQQTRLTELVRFARARSPFYRALYRDLPEDVEDLRQLPPVTKPGLMASFDDWVTDRKVTRAEVEAFMTDERLVGHRYLGRYAVWSTSGITGERGIFLHDPAALAVYRVLTLLRGWLPWMTPGRLWPTLRRGNRVAAVVAGSLQYGSASIMEAARREHPRPFNHVRVFSVLRPVSELVLALNDFQPALLLGYASALTVLAREQAAGRLAIRPALVGSGGEWLPPPARCEIEAAFRCRVRENYGASEFPPLAWECFRGRLHVGADWVILEPVDEQYRPVPAGRPSYSTLLTNLANRIQPLIRYELGDTVTVGPEPCRCGSPLSWVRVQGRRNEILSIQAPSGETVSLPPLVLTLALLRVPGVQRRQVIQTGPTRLRVRLEVESGTDLEAVSVTAIRRLRAELAVHGLEHVEVEQALEPPAADPVSGKYRQVWSELG